VEDHLLRRCKLAACSRWSFFLAAAARPRS